MSSGHLISPSVRDVHTGCYGVIVLSVETLITSNTTCNGDNSKCGNEVDQESSDVSYIFFSFFLSFLFFLLSFFFFSLFFLFFFFSFFLSFLFVFSVSGIFSRQSFCSLPLFIAWHPTLSLSLFTLFLFNLFNGVSDTSAWTSTPYYCLLRGRRKLQATAVP